MIVLFTDYGIGSPYVAQLKTVLHQRLKRPVIIDLCHDAPRGNPIAAAYLLASWANDFTKGTVFICVVDPDVGSQQQRAALVEADGRWFIGPDNGLFNSVIKRSKKTRWWDINWHPENLSATFHGRDLYAPVASRLILREAIPNTDEQAIQDRAQPFWGDQLNQIVYIDSFGNAMTGLFADKADSEQVVVLGKDKQRLACARTYSDVPEGQAFWYKNAYGMLEIAVNQGRAVDVLDLKIGDAVDFHQK